jgi:hypothetical protein
MQPKTKKIIGWTASVLVSLALVASAVDKIYLSGHAVEVSGIVGIAPNVYRMLGIIELLSVLLFLIPRTGILGLLLLASYMGGAIATHLQHAQGILFPAAFGAVVWLGAVLRYPELVQRISTTNKG